MGDINTIILAAGRSDAKNLSAGLITEVGLLPVHGRPAIAWVIESARKNGAGDIRIIMRRDNTRLARFLEYRYPEVRRSFLTRDGDVSLSLAALLDLCDPAKPVQVILGDTLIHETFPEESDVFLSSPDIRASRNWCLVEKDAENRIARVYDKERDVPLAGKEALVGYYKFSDTALLRRLAAAETSRPEPSFTRILLSYNRERPVHVKTTANWFDFGHISGAVRARLNLFSAREFNTLKADPVRGTITKISAKKQKLLDEAHWYRELPPELSCFAPRVFSVRETPETAEVEMEMYGYANLAETFVYGSNNLEDWYNITETLFRIHAIFEKHELPADPEEPREIYLAKTEQRLAELGTKAPGVYEMTRSDYLTVSGRRFKNLPLLRDDMYKALAGLVGTGRRTIVHGDYCFSNILFDSTHFIFRLVDPRGRFRDRTIYGDPRYDIAKLRHSIAGLYDFIVAGFFDLSQTGPDSWDFRVSGPLMAEKLAAFFDETAAARGYDVAEIKLIEASLFLTMIPLHGEDPRRQRAFYLTAIMKLNEALYGERR